MPERKPLKVWDSRQIPHEKQNWPLQIGKSTGNLHVFICFKDVTVHIINQYKSSTYIWGCSMFSTYHWRNIDPIMWTPLLESQLYMKTMFISFHFKKHVGSACIGWLKVKKPMVGWRPGCAKAPTYAAEGTALRLSVPWISSKILDLGSKKKDIQRF